MTAFPGQAIPLSFVNQDENKSEGPSKTVYEISFLQ